MIPVRSPAGKTDTKQMLFVMKSLEELESLEGPNLVPGVRGSLEEGCSNWQQKNG